MYDSHNVGPIGGASPAELTYLVDHPRNQSSEIAALCGDLPNRRALRLVNIVWFCSEWNPGDLQPLAQLGQACRDLGLHYRVNLIVPSDTDYFVKRSGEQTSVDMLLQISRNLQEEGTRVRWLLSIHPDLLFRIEALYCLARDEHVEPLLVVPDHFDETSTIRDLTSDERLFAWDFITYRVLGADHVRLTSHQRDYYRVLVKYLDNPESCGRVTVSAAGMRQLALDIGRHDNSRSVSWSNLFALVQDVFDILPDALSAYWQRIRVRVSSLKPIRSRERFDSVLLIGAYGGEHIGDIAILGGVLRRIHERFGTTQATLMTQRVNHTRHLVPILDTPVQLAVDDYERSQIRRHLKHVDAVVFAGGPLVDIPKQLVRHLYTASLANRMGKPFLAEGIGPGPFTRAASRFTAKRMIELAGHINVRTSDSKGHEVVKNLDVQVGHCPAFDYLATRSNVLTRLPKTESAAIDRLLKDTENRPIIAINIRPIGHLHTIGAPDSDLAGYTRKIEDRFETQFAEGLREFDRTATRKPCYVYFPMNAIQFGSSDILSAYRIRRSLGPAVDFRVWQADVSLDGAIALLRRADVAITMRFHATIFALSQSVHAIGIDYRIGERDKVAELMDDAGQGENCERIDLLTSDWLVDRLQSLTSLSSQSS